MANSAKREDAIPENAEVLARAVRKVVDGKKEDLTREESQALQRHEKDKEERLRWQFYESIPQKHWRQMSGRQAKVLIEQAALHGIPFGGATISLPKVVKAYHDFLAANKFKLCRDEDDLLSGPNSPALERYREERALMAKLNRLEREGQLLPRDDTRQVLLKIAGVIRQAGETLHKQFGEEAARVLYEGIDDAVAEIERYFAAPIPLLPPDEMPLALPHRVQESSEEESEAEQDDLDEAD